MTNKIEMTSQKKIVIAALISCFFLLIGLIMLGSNQSSDLGLADIVHSKTNATQSTYKKRSPMTRDKIEATLRNSDRRIVFINDKIVSGCSNNTSNVATGTYQKSATFGHTASAKVKAVVEIFEVEGSFTYSESRTVVETFSYIINPHETVTVWQRDIRVLEEDFDVTTTNEVKVGSIFAWFIPWWESTGSYYSPERIVGYNGSIIELR